MATSFGFASCVCVDIRDMDGDRGRNIAMQQGDTQQRGSFCRGHDEERRNRRTRYEVANVSQTWYEVAKGVCCAVPC